MNLCLSQLRDRTTRRSRRGWDSKPHPEPIVEAAARHENRRSGSDFRGACILLGGVG